METINPNRKQEDLNAVLLKSAVFFKSFSGLEAKAYSEGAIPKKYKELTGLSISILTRCHECVLYHLQRCVEEKVNKKELIEAINFGAIAGGPTTYPTARFIFKAITDFEQMAIRHLKRKGLLPDGKMCLSRSINSPWKRQRRNNKKNRSIAI